MTSNYNQNNYQYRKFLLNSIPKQQTNNNSIIKVNYTSDKKIMSLMPSKFQSSDGGASFSQGRSIFLNTENKSIPTNYFTLKQAFDKEKNNKNTSIVGKYLPVQSGDQHIQRLKNRAIGRGTLAKHEGDSYVASFTGNNKTKNSINDQNTQQALRRVRNRGYVVPPKVIANTKRNVPGTCLTSV